MDLPLYRLDIDESTGLDAIALVDIPAVQTFWQTFNDVKDKMMFVADNEKRIVGGVLMAANMPIYRKDKSGREYYVSFTAKAIENIAYQSAKRGIHTMFNIMHDANQKAPSVTLVEHYIVDRAKGKGVLPGHEHVEDGSWYGFAKIENDQLWADIKAGKYNGFSVEGDFIKEAEGRYPKSVIEAVIEEALNEFLTN
jgi:hypothetical protein